MPVTAKGNDMNFEDTPPDEKFFAGFDKQVLKVRTVRARDAEIEDLKALLLWALWHHQGASSPVGQPIRRALGIGPHDALTVGQVHAGSDVVARVMRHNAEVSGPSTRPPGYRAGNNLGEK
jgi:hypothetical protein